MKQITVKQLAHYLLYPDTLSNLPIQDWQNLVLIFRESKLLATLYYILQKHALYDDLPNYAKRHLKSASVYAERQRQQVIFESHNLDILLSEIGLTPIYLKGANYILRDCSNSCGRIVSDIDVLVPKNAIGKTESLLKNNLWQSEELSDYDEKYYRQWAHEIPPLAHLLRQTVLDVHHNLYLPVSGRALDIDLFVEKAELTAAKHRVLCPADTVLHSIIHLYMNEDFTNAFRDLYDLYLLIKEFDDEAFWQRLAFMAEKTGYEKEVYYCLATLDELFEFTAPKLFSALQNKYKNIRSHFFIKNIVLNAVTPKHSLLDKPKTKFARFVMFMRGHYLKMPPHILLYHLTIKSFLGVVEMIFGKHFLDKD